MITYLHILDLKLSKPIVYLGLDDVLNYRSSNSNAWFQGTFIEDNVLQSEFYYQTYTSIWIYDEKLNKPVKTKTQILGSVKFAIDFNLDLVEFYGNKKDYSRFVKCLLERLHFVESISTPLIHLDKFYIELNLITEVVLLGLSILDFELDNQLIGKYVARFHGDVNRSGILNQYYDKVDYIQFKLESFDNTEYIGLNRSASYKINSKTTNITEIIKILKTIQKLSYA